MAEYGLDLRVEFRRMSARRLWALIDNLPLESAVWSGESRWTRKDELLASILERVDAWGRLNFAVSGGKANVDPTKYGIKVRRPEAQEESKPEGTVAATPEEIAKFFGV